MAVAKHTGNPDGGGEEPLDGGLAIDGIAGAHLGQHRAGDAEEAQQVVVPLHGVDVEEHGARGVGAVGGVHAPAGELPDEPGVDGAHEQVAALGCCPCSGGVVEQPCHAGGCEVGVDEQSGTLHDQGAAAVSFQALAQFAPAGVLPYDGA